MTKENYSKIMQFVEKINDAQVVAYNAEKELMDRRCELVEYLDKCVKETEQENTAKVPHKYDISR